MNWHIENINIEKRKRTFERLRIQISNMSGCMDMSPQFSDKVSVNHLLSLIVKQALDVMSVSICIIWLKDKKGHLVPRISFGLKSNFIQKMKITTQASFFASILKKENPAVINNTAAVKNVQLKRLIRKESFETIVASSLIVGKEKMGILMICTTPPRLFSPAELKIFDALVRQAALAIGNAGLYEKMGKKIKDKVKKMEVIFSMSRTITSSIDEHLIFDFILEKTAQLMNARICVLNLFNRRNNRLSLQSYLGVDRTDAVELKKFERSFSKEVFKTNLPCVISDLYAYAKERLPKCIVKKEINSLIIMPLAGPKRKVGVLSVYMPEVRIFSKEDYEVLELIGSLCSMAIENINMLERIKKDYLNMVKTLAKIIDENDRYTRGHCEKVMKYAMIICKGLRLSQRATHAVKTASLLHDIGKVGVDVSIVRKKGSLTKVEKQKISLHPEIGARIVNQSGFLNEIVPIIRYHHEHFGGGGYPDPGKIGSDIPLGARIVAVADAYDAMTSDRPYRRAFPKKKALEELRRCSSTQFDPKIVNLFLKKVSR